MDLNAKGFWDDSGLISEWDKAVEEYKKYHSNGSSEIRPRPAKKQKTDRNWSTKAYHDLEGSDLEVRSGDEPEGTLVRKTGDILVEKQDGVSDEKDDLEDEEKEDDTRSEQPEIVTGSNSTPISLEGLDDSVKNLVMAWYWAGYYQGLAVGQKNK